MKFIADLHIHSHFSRATSRTLDPENLTLWAQKKGITIIGTGDFTHPEWVKELEGKLIEAEKGLYRLKPEYAKYLEDEIPGSCKNTMRFLLTSEISCIYKRGGKTRKIHNLILMPDLESVKKLNRNLDRIGNINSDGRPILGLDSRDLLDMVLEGNERAFFIPAHIWTPWFSLFGSKSGFDAIEECFGDLTPHIHALETGLSSDPPMNRLLSSLDKYLLVSNSDAHSPSKLGREANIFDTELDYDHIVNAMITKKGFVGTIEFYPEEGKYHLDGHRKCGIRLHPEETRKYGGICPSCGRALTIGVLNRIVELSDRNSPEISKEYFSLIPLPEILAEIYGCGPATKKVAHVYESLLNRFGPELAILMDVKIEEIEKAGTAFLSTAIDRMRRGQVIRQEGYDGEFGVIRLFHDQEKEELAGQTSFIQTPGEAVKKIVPVFNRKRGAGPSENPVVFLQKEITDPILGPLNERQKEAVTYQKGHLLILAGPGTGKTMTLTHRIAHMIVSGVTEAGQVLALTFTNKAALEMRSRIGAILSRKESEKVVASTFHSFCLDVLRNESGLLGLPPDFQICSQDDATLLMELAVSESGKGKHFASKILKGISDLKMISMSGSGYPEEYSELLPFIEKYKLKLREHGMIDLDDLETETLTLFKSRPEIGERYSKRFPMIFVDEYQDCNPLQIAVLKGLVRGKGCYICAIGDPDQSIYGFRGADVRRFHGFAEDFPGAKVIFLSMNYRSTDTILNAAADLMGKDCPLEGNKGKGSSIRTGHCASPAEEAEMVVEQIEKMIGGISHFSMDSGRVFPGEGGDEIGFGDIAVLFRLNAQAGAFEDALSRAGIPFIRSGEKPLRSVYPADIIFRFFQTIYFPENPIYYHAYMGLLKEKDINGEGILKRYRHDDDLQQAI
ncbi:MAG: UvrD-helicase domain-containing protein, partial [Deltaproteobacteria bacterium]|nr:UvrD-helicase domain-containing protein [Deltaproteobacteria bacterium]